MTTRTGKLVIGFVVRKDDGLYYVFETRNGKVASKPVGNFSSYSYTAAIGHAKALGALRSGNTAAALPEVDAIEQAPQFTAHTAPRDFREGRNPFAWS